MEEIVLGGLEVVAVVVGLRGSSRGDGLNLGMVAGLLGGKENGGLKDGTGFRGCFGTSSTPRRRRDFKHTRVVRMKQAVKLSQ